VSSSFRARAARRTRRAAALLGLLVVGVSAAGAIIASPAAAAEPVPTMTFKGITLLGLLDSLAVSPSAVDVPASGKVTFVNGLAHPIKMTVGGREFSLPANGAQTLVFPGAAQPQQVKASAKTLDIPLVGVLTSPTGTVNVAAAPNTQPPDPEQPAPSKTSSPGGDPGAPNTPGAPPQPGSPATVVPQSLPGGVKVPPNFGRDPVARGGMASAGFPPITAEEAGMASQDTSGAPDEASTRVDSAAGPDGKITMVGGGIGLLILVATVLLGGIGSAAIRTVLAQRSADMRS